MHASSTSRPTIAAEVVVFRPPRALGVIIGGAIAAWAAVFALVCAAIAWGSPAEFRTFLAWLAAAVLGGLALLFLNWTYSIATMTYVVSRDVLVITWGFRRVIVPIETIQRMVPGRTVDDPAVNGLNWWGCHVGAADVARIGYTLFYSTHSKPSELLYVVTDGEAYALTILDQAAFAEAIQARASLGPLDGSLHRAVATGMAALPFWRDRVALVAAGVSSLACAVLVGYVFASYPGLPSVVQLNYPELGGIVRIGDKSELLGLAQAGAGILFVNLVLGVVIHSRERAAGLWLLGSAGILQLILIGAAILAFQYA